MNKKLTKTKISMKTENSMQSVYRALTGELSIGQVFVDHFEQIFL